MKRAVVVVPVFKPILEEDEELAVSFLREHLSRYERVVIAPEGMTLAHLSDFRVVYFPSRFFRSVYAYNQLMLSRRFYRAFADIDFVLIYQLDGLVFSDELARWCELDYDYIGAPVFSLTEERRIIALNGGFSLRRLKAFRRALHRGEWPLLLQAHREMPFMSRNVVLRALKFCLLVIHFAGLANVVPALIWNSNQHEDVFWSRYARFFISSFRVAPDDVAAAFAFEAQPAKLFKQLGERLPFGCHAWRKWEPEFWMKQLQPIPDKANRCI